MKISPSPDMPIGQAAVRWPAILPVLERLRLDYCCHGSRTIQQACDYAGLPLQDVLRAIDERSPCSTTDADAAGWSSDSLASLCDHIVSTHHARARESFDLLGTLMPRVRSAHATAHPELAAIEQILVELRGEMLDHMIREERVLFPWFKRIDDPSTVSVGPLWSVTRPIDCMLHDHDSVAASLTTIRQLTSEYAAPVDACGSYRAMLDGLRELEQDTHVHIHKENNILFPKSILAETMRRDARVAPACGTPQACT